MPRRIARSAKIIGNFFILIVIMLLFSTYYPYVFLIWGPTFRGIYLSHYNIHNIQISLSLSLWFTYLYFYRKLDFTRHGFYINIFHDHADLVFYTMHHHWSRKSSYLLGIYYKSNHQSSIINLNININLYIFHSKYILNFIWFVLWNSFVKSAELILNLGILYGRFGTEAEKILSHV